jgi:hypothetical protein
MDGGVHTVRIAAEDVTGLPQPFQTTQRYSVPFSLEAAGKLNVAATLANMSFQVFPVSRLFCH